MSGTPRLVGFLDELNPSADLRWIAQICTGYGMCNRLRAWVGIGAMADIRGQPFVTCWEPCPQCPGVFEDCFIVDNCVVARTADEVLALKCDHRYVAKRSSRLTQYYKNQGKFNKSVFGRAATARRKTLKLKLELQEQLEEFLTTLPPDVVGLHVRRTDLRLPPSTNIRLRRTLDAVVERTPGVAFLLCADDPATVYGMRKRYGKRMHWRQQQMTPQPERRFRCSRATSLQDAALDLFALASTKRIIGTRNSSFSYFASQLGGCRLARV